MESKINEWHVKNLTWFSYDPNFDNTDILELCKKLAYHNYCIWHLIEGYKDPDTNIG
jgi:hypothetical protein